MNNIYTLMNGINLDTFIILPMLGKHPDEYPRFRDCFLYEDKILILTRVGGINRGQGYGEESMTNDPNFIETVDADKHPIGELVNNDNTYGIYIFKIPDKWKHVYEAIINHQKLPNDYIDEMIRVYPKLKDKFELLKVKLFS